jgi:hypothetical protein
LHRWLREQKRRLSDLDGFHRYTSNDLDLSSHYFVRRHYDNVHSCRRTHSCPVLADGKPELIRAIGGDNAGHADRTLRDGNPVIHGLERPQAGEQRRLPRYPDGGRWKRHGRGKRHPRAGGTAAAITRLGGRRGEQSD